MLVGGLGTIEIIVLLIVMLIVVAVPMVEARIRMRAQRRVLSAPSRSKQKQEFVDSAAENWCNELPPVPQPKRLQPTPLFSSVDA